MTFVLWLEQLNEWWFFLLGWTTLEEKQVWGHNQQYCFGFVEF